MEVCPRCGGKIKHRKLLQLRMWDFFNEGYPESGLLKRDRWYVPNQSAPRRMYVYTTSAEPPNLNLMIHRIHLMGSKAINLDCEALTAGEKIGKFGKEHQSYSEFTPAIFEHAVRKLQSSTIFTGDHIGPTEEGEAFLEGIAEKSAHVIAYV